MASGSFKDRMSGKEVEALPLIDFEEAALHASTALECPA